MTAYYILIFFPIVFVLLHPFKRETSSNKIAIASFFFIWLLMLVFRDISIGCDLIKYEYYFDEISRTKWSSLFTDFELEKGFCVFTKVVSLFTDNFHIYKSIIAIISIIPFMFLYVKESKSPILSIAILLSIGVFPIFFSGMRQILAMSLIPIAFYYVRRKNLIGFILCVIIATLFHNSAIILSFMYPVYHFKYGRNNFIIIFVLVMLVLFLRATIWRYTFSIIGGRYEEMYGDVTETGAFMLALLIFLFLVYSFIIPDLKKLPSEYLKMRNFLIFSMLLIPFSGVSTIAMRMNHYYSVFIPLIIPAVSEYTSNANKPYIKIISAVVIVFFISRFFFGAYHGEDIIQIFPYKSYIDF